MLSGHPVYATIPTQDVASLRRFYEDVLGFPVQRETPSTIYYDAGGGTFFAVSRSAGQSSGSHTQMAFRVDDIQGEVTALRANGVASRSTRRRRRSTGSPTSAPAGRPGSRTRTGT